MRAAFVFRGKGKTRKAFVWRERGGAAMNKKSFRCFILVIAIVLSVTLLRQAF
jgi:hypothetical protein